MILSERTKKRKIKNEIDYTLNTIYGKSNDIFQEVSPSVNLCDNNESINTVLNVLSPTMFSPIAKIPDVVLLSTSTSNTCSEEISDILCDNVGEFSIVQHNFSLRDFLASWALDFNISHIALNGLLKGLKKHECFKDLPVDSRTILSTPKNIYQGIQTVMPGIYHHFGLSSAILKYTPNNVNEVNIAIGIDGVPLSKSSGGQFWPILGYIISQKSSRKNVFPIGIYYGFEKPNNSNEFLSNFVDEAKFLINNGIIKNNNTIKISIKVFCLDVPAKSYILRTKGHSGFSSCTRCTIEGEYINNRVCFPYSQMPSLKRNHSSYINKLDEDFHTSNELTRLIELPGFDSINSFSLDYMHLICLGVMKKLLFLWTKGPLNVRLRSKSVDDLSSSLLSLKNCITSDFVRSVRSMKELSRFKATEFRTIVLYVGQIVFKNVISKKCYEHFMTLNISMLILLSPDKSTLVDYARDLLNYFVKRFGEIYGSYHMSHNIHGLLHLCDDYDLYGPLDNCSTFVFENYLKELKSLLRKHEKPLAQIINRLAEKDNITAMQEISEITHRHDKLSQDIILKQTHTNGPLIENIFGPQYYDLFYENIHINIKKEKDSYVLTKDNTLVKCLNIAHLNNKPVLIGKFFKSLLPCYMKPLDSTLLDIFEVKNLSKNMHYWPICDIKKKIMILKHGGKLIAMPIIHSTVEE